MPTPTKTLTDDEESLLAMSLEIIKNAKDNVFKVWNANSREYMVLSEVIDHLDCAEIEVRKTLSKHSRP